MAYKYTVKKLDSSKNPKKIKLGEPANKVPKRVSVSRSLFAQSVADTRFATFVKNVQKYVEFMNEMFEVKISSSFGWVKKLNQVLEFIDRNKNYIASNPDISDSVKKEYVESLKILDKKTKLFLEKIVALKEQIDIIYSESIEKKQPGKLSGFEKAKRQIEGRKGPTNTKEKMKNGYSR